MKLLDAVTRKIKLMPAKPVVYMAETSADLKPQQAAVRQDLEHRGYTVLPQQPLPTDREQISSFVQEQLANASMAVSMVGSGYGEVVEATAASLVETQVSLAKERARNGNFVCLVWMPRGLGTVANQIQDPLSQDFVDRLRLDNSWGPNSDLLETPLEGLKTEIDEHLKQLERETRPRKTATHLLSLEN